MNRSYTVKGRKVNLNIDEDFVAVRFKTATPNSVRAAATRESDLDDYENRLELSREEFVVIPLVSPKDKSARLSQATSTMGGNDSVERVAQVFKSGNKRLVATERLIVGFKEGSAEIDEILGKYGLVTIEEFGDNERLVKAQAHLDPIDIVDKISKEAAVDYAEPDFVIIGKHIARRLSQPPRLGRPSTLHPTPSNDPLTDDQYAIFITEADLAWNYATGSPDVRIAILDEGVDTSHPDLAGAVVERYDATDDDAWQQPMPWDAHGTACSGLAAAIHWNGKGIRGIGGGCSLLAVRIAYSESPEGDWITTDNWIRRAIDWCVAHHADVLSNSWGGGEYSHSIARAFERARTRGRSGKGAVVVVAAGNQSGPVDFPGYLPNVLTVSASNEFDEFKTRTSQDGEYWWGSNFGSEVDVAAPGVHNLTTDITGSSGYTETDYTDFNGTSSATPIVAGACGLLISTNRQLTEVRVREIIRDSADKVGQFPYDGVRNDQMGHGRVNVRRAVELA